jgi:hypothetical protein
MIDYLLAALMLEAEGNPIYEIGGADIVSYGDILREYSRQRGLHRLMIPVPVLTPRLSSLWLGLVTPLYARVGRKLIDSMIHPTVVRDNTALRVFSIRPREMREAIALALRNEDTDYRGTRWSDAMSAACQPRDWGGVRFGNRLVDSRVMHVDISPERAFAPIQHIGARKDGTTVSGCGSCAVCSTCWPAESGCVAAGATLNYWKLARRSIAGASRRSIPRVSSCWQLKCGCRAARGSTSRSRRKEAVQRSGRRLYSIRSACRESRTGTGFFRCISWYSPACFAESYTPRASRRMRANLTPDPLPM